MAAHGARGATTPPPAAARISTARTTFQLATILLAAPTQNWAVDIVEWGKTSNVRVDFTSSHAYSTPCGNATGLYLALKLFHVVIGNSTSPLTPPLVTEWSSNSLPDGVNCSDVYDTAPNKNATIIEEYHDTAAQASFAAKTPYLVDGMFPLLSHWAFSDLFEEQGWTWDGLVCLITSAFANRSTRPSACLPMPAPSAAASAAARQPWTKYNTTLTPPSPAQR